MATIVSKACEYQRVMDDVCARIASGSLAPSQRIGSIRSLSDRYGMSINPVQRALKELEQHAVLCKTGGGKKGGYVVADGAAAVAISLRRSRVETPVGSEIRGDVGLLFCGEPDYTSRAASFFMMPMLHALQEELVAERCRAVMSVVSQENAHEQYAYFRLMGKMLDGLILTRGVWAEPVVEVLAKLGVPLVWLDQPAPPWAKRLSVRQFELLTDDETAVAAGIRNLHEMGHCRIGLIGFDAPAVYARVAGYRRGLAEAGLKYKSSELEKMVSGVAHEEFTELRLVAKQAMAELLNRSQPPTAVFCTSDIVAFGAIDCLHERSLTPGADVAILGYDDVEQGGYRPFGEPMLTTLQKPRREMGAQAARLLVEQRVNPTYSGIKRITLAPQWVDRQTCAPVSAARQSKFK